MLRLQLPWFSAFAAILGDGSMVTWDCAEYGGDSSGVQDQLQSVLCIQRSVRAFAAIRADGFVVTWGSAQSGGDSTAVQDQLHYVQLSELLLEPLLRCGLMNRW